MTEVSLRELQLAELDILREFVQLCETHSLQYFLIGGTLLGAIRHSGFIPWDDDIDIGMPRGDYERLARQFRQGRLGRLGWQTYRTEPAFPFLFAKMLDLDTTLYDETTQDLPIRHHVGIDVFPLDGTPSSRLGRAVHRWFLRFCRLRLGASLKHHHPGKHALAFLIRLLPRRIVIEAYESIAARFSFDRSPIVVNGGGAWGYAREAVPQTWFGTGTSVSFEGQSLCAPAAWDRYLEHIYGDFRTPPPASGRRTTHNLRRVELAKTPLRPTVLTPEGQGS